MSITPGTSLANYRITAALGAGGMGEVWRAEDTKLGREVALKVLPEEFAKDPERMARFEREAKVLASLNHPNIATLYGLETVESGTETETGTVQTTFLAMEVVEGEDLSERIKRGPIPIHEAIPIALQIAEALEAAHEQGIVHRDLKPANIKITEDGVVKVLDFGLAKNWETETGDYSLSLSPTVTHATAAGVILGTAAYMSPEQARGKRADRRADIWSFGVVVWEMLTGHKLFEGETVSDVLAAVLRAEPDLTAVPKGTPESVRRLLARCLERDPRTRLQWIGEARIALGDSDVRTEKPLPAKPNTLSRRIWTPIGVAAVALVIISVVGWKVFGPQPAQIPLRKLELEAAGVESRRWFAGPVLSPDGSKIAFSSRGAIWVRDLGELAERQVAEISEPSLLFWDPDSTSLAYANQKKLWRVDADGGRNIVLCDLPDSGSAIGGAWRNDGLIAFASWRGAMYSVQATGGRPTIMFENESRSEIDFHDPTWMPDGRLLFVAHREASATASNGDGSGASAGGDLADMEIGLFDGEHRTVVDLDTDGKLSWLVYDHRTEHLLYTRETPSPGVWAIPVDPDDLSPKGAEFLIAPNGATVSLGTEGSLIYVERAILQTTNELVVTDLSGTVQSVVAAARPGLAEPSLSPDGRWVVATAIGDASREVWIIDLQRGTDSRLTFDEVDEFRPSWFPSSREIVYSEIHGMEANIVARAIDGSGGRRELVSGIGYGMWSGLAQVSPDGRQLVYAIDEDGPMYLYVAGFAEDGSPTSKEPLFSLDDQPSVEDARISPDGSLLAYMTTDSGQPEVFLTRFPSGEGRWQVSDGGGRKPRWASESGDLFFVSGSGPAERILTRVRVLSGTELVVGEPESLFQIVEADGVTPGNTGFDVMPGGEEFILVRREGGKGSPTRRMILVQNWMREFEGKQ